MRGIQSPGLAFQVVLIAWACLVASPVGAGESSTEVARPESPVAIWSAIDNSVAAMRALVASGDLEGVHHQAFAVRDLTRGLLGRSANLAPEALEQVEASVGYVATLAQRLDESGDANDAAGAKANLEKLERILAGIRVHYPKVPLHSR